MTRGEFDPQFDDRDEPEPWGATGGPDEPIDIIPPEVLNAGIEMTKQVEQGLQPHPGDKDPDEKSVDPDEWHH
jgi:hypothetical protein